MDDCVGYTKPEVLDYGSLVEMTADVDHLNLSAGVLRAVAGAAVISAPLIPGTSGDDGGVQTVQGTGGNGGAALPTDDVGGGNDPAGTLGDQDPGTQELAAGPGGSGSGGGGGGASSGGGGGGGRLPFTGLSVMLVAAVGAAFAATGTWLRVRLRRGNWPRPRF